jgi:hypothetical protein
LTASRCGRDAGCLVHGDSADVIADQFDFGSVDPLPDLDAKAADGVADPDGRTDRPGRTIEDREESIAGGLNLTTTEAVELVADEAVVTPQKLAPRAVTDP